VSIRSLVNKGFPHRANFINLKILRLMHSRLQTGTGLGSVATLHQRPGLLSSTARTT